MAALLILFCAGSGFGPNNHKDKQNDTLTIILFSLSVQYFMPSIDIQYFITK